MGTILTGYGEASDDHEGYAAELLDDGSLSGTDSNQTRPRMVGRLVVVCDCGWTVSTRYPTTRLVDERAGELRERAACVVEQTEETW